LIKCKCNTWTKKPTKTNHAEEEEELIRVQQEIERLRQEQESIMRRQAAVCGGNDLYKTSVFGLLLHCVNKAEGQEPLSGIHAGVCGGHIGVRVVAAMVLQQGFYGTVVIDDAVKLVPTCEACEKFSHRLKGPAQPVLLITPSWPLQRWGIDIIGKLTLAQGNYTFSVVAVEYFTLWVEAKLVTNISSATIKKFF
jgi:hypothetical protein